MIGIRFTGVPAYIHTHSKLYNNVGERKTKNKIVPIGD